MKYKKDKEFFKVDKADAKKVKGLSNTFKVIKMCKIDKLMLIGLILIHIVLITISTLSALLSKEIFNVFSTYEYEKLLTFAFYFLALETSYYVFDYINQIIQRKFKDDIILKTKKMSYERVLGMKASCFVTTQTSTFTQRINEGSAIVDFFDIALRSFRHICVSIAYCTVLFTTTPILAGVSALFYLIKLISYRYILPKHNSISRKIRKIDDKATNIAVETIRGSSDVKSLNFSATLHENYVDIIQDCRQKQYSLGMWWINRLFPTNFIAFALNTFVFILLIWYFMTNNIAEAGAVLFFWSYRGWLNQFFNSIYDLFSKIPKVEVATSRMMELYDESLYPLETFGTKTLDNVKGNVKFKNVSFAYEKGKPVLKNINIDIEANKITAIVGKTGCGKSTTLSLIARFYDANKGKVLLDGVDVKELTKECLRGTMGYVQQSPYIFNRTFKENLLLVKPDATDVEIENACKKSEIHDFILTTKDKYDTLIGENGISLSGGQRQRLAIARAVLNNSKIIMFDESTSSLDNESQAKIQATIENLSKNHTIIVVAHRLSTIINADKIIFMDNHKVKATGTHNELFENCQEYRDLYEIENIN